MREFRFYITNDMKVGESLTLPEAIARHMVKVLRMLPGTAVNLFNGNNHEYKAVLTQVSKKNVVVDIIGEQFCDNESSLNVRLVQALSKGDKMEVTIQKCVELGVQRISPVSTQYGNVNTSSDRLAKKVIYWQGVIESACGQSGRNKLPELNDPVALVKLLDQSKSIAGLKLFLDPEQGMTLGDIDRPKQSVTVLIGPEGGLSDQEIALARSAGFVGIKIGPRILRTETAGPAILAILQARWGDLA